jgi:hypothetical protein
MSRVRSLFAAVLSGLAIPAVGQTTPPEANSSAADQLTAFTQARNAEIAASIATVNAARFTAKIQTMITKAHEAQFARTRNAEVEETLATVAAVRAAEFEHARNAEIETVLGAYREAQFARQRNAEIDVSINAVSVERGREYVRETNARADADRAAAREAEFARARNAEIDRAIAASQDAAFGRARNAEAEASIAAVNAQRVLLDTGSITTPTRPLRQIAAAFYSTLMLLSILLMGGGLTARRWRLGRGYLGAKLHLAYEAQSALRTISRMADQIRSHRNFPHRRAPADARARVL